MPPDQFQVGRIADGEVFAMSETALTFRRLGILLLSASALFVIIAWCTAVILGEGNRITGEMIEIGSKYLFPAIFVGFVSWIPGLIFSRKLKLW